MAKNDVFLRPINNSSIVQQVIDRLTDAMISRELKPGDKIPTEVELAENFGVGRNSIREAIKILVYFGVLEIRRAEGTFVRKGFSESMIDPMLYGIILNTDDSWDSLKELRELMEVGVVKLAMKKGNQEDIQLMHEKYQALKEAMNQPNYDVNEVFEADNQFHETVSSMGHNPLVDRINTVVRELTHSMRMRTVTNMMKNGEKDMLLKVHEEICDLIINKREETIDKVIQGSYFYDKGILEETTEEREPKKSMA